MPRFVSGLDRTVVPDPGAVIGVRIGVEHLAPCAGVRQSQPIAGMFGAGEVEHARHHRAVVAEAQEAQHIVGRVVRVDPGVPLGLCVPGPQRPSGAVDLVGIGQQPQNAVGEPVLVELEPVHAAFLGPLRSLSELLPHEQQLFARMRPLVGQETADPGGLHVVVAGHAPPQRALAVHHLVVADRQDVILAERVEHRERHLVMVIGPVDRVTLDELQRVVHPAHVPFHREAQPAEVRRAGHARPRRGLLGDRDDAGADLVHRRVHLLQELDRLEVLPAPVLVRRPATFRTRVVQIEHRCDRIHPQAVDVELLQPVQRVGDQEVADLGAAEVEHVGAPVELLAAARIGVLVERGAVESAQRPRVLGEVRGHPVDDHTDTGPVQRVDQVAELVG